MNQRGLYNICEAFYVQYKNLLKWYILEALRRTEMAGRKSGLDESERIYNICTDFLVHVTYFKSLEYFIITFLSLHSQRERPKLVGYFKDIEVFMASYKDNTLIPPPSPVSHIFISS